MKKVLALFVAALFSISLLSGCLANDDETVIVAESGNSLNDGITTMSFHVTGAFDAKTCPELITNALVGQVTGVDSVNVTSSGDVQVVFVGRTKGEEQNITSEISDKLKTVKHGIENTHFGYVSR